MEVEVTAHTRQGKLLLEPGARVLVDGLVAVDLECDTGFERRASSRIEIGTDLDEQEPVDFDIPLPDETAFDLDVSINGCPWLFLRVAGLWVPSDLQGRLQTIADAGYDENTAHGTGEGLSGWQDLRHYSGRYYETNEEDDLWATKSSSYAAEARMFLENLGFLSDEQNPIEDFYVASPYLTLDELEPFVPEIDNELFIEETEVTVRGSDGWRKVRPRPEDPSPPAVGE